MQGRFYREALSGRLWRLCWNGGGKALWMRSHPDNRDLKAFAAQDIENGLLRPEPEGPAPIGSGEAGRPLIVLGPVPAGLRPILEALAREGVEVRMVPTVEGLAELPRAGAPFLVVVIDDGAPLPAPPLGADLPHLLVVKDGRGSRRADGARLGYAAVCDEGAPHVTVETIRAFVDHMRLGRPKVAVLAEDPSEASRLCILLELNGVESRRADTPGQVSCTFPGGVCPEVVLVEADRRTTQAWIKHLRALESVAGTPVIALGDDAGAGATTAPSMKVVTLPTAVMAGVLVERLRSLAASERGLPRWFD